MYIELRKQYSHRFSNQTDQVDLKHAAAASVASSNICDSLDSYIGDHLESFGFLNKMVATNNRYCALKSLIPGEVIDIQMQILSLTQRKNNYVLFLLFFSPSQCIKFTFAITGFFLKLL